MTDRPTAQNCPSMERWVLLASGLVAEPEREQLLEHANGCDSCGTALRCAVEDLSEEPTEAEQQEILSLHTATPEWRRSFARQMMRRRPVPFPVLKWLSVAAAIVLVAGGSWLGFARLFPSPAQLLARAYTEQRPFEFRIPGAAYAPIRIERSGLGAAFNRPPALLDAQAKIAGRLQAEPDNAELLVLRARVELLEWDPEAAIATLTRALDQKPEDPDLLAALGAAYALRAEVKNNAIDYGRAMEQLSRSLRAKPDSLETIFNRALVYQRMFLYEEARQDWRHYLEIDPNSEWAKEAARRLAEIEQKKKVRRDALDRITEDPLAFLVRLDSGDQALEPESYLNVAITRWLPRRWQAETYERALEKLAALYESRHRDRWLRDVLAARRSDALIGGLRNLGEALDANLSDDWKLALRLTSRASRQLRQAGSEPAALRADTEQVYALRRTYAATACVTEATNAARKADAGRYAWILAQLRIELGICHMMPGNVAFGQQALALALDGAHGSGYQSLELRAKGILLGEKVNAGNMLGAWDEGREALRAFWNGAYVGTRGQQIYIVLQRAAAALEMNSCAYALAHASVNAIEETRHASVEALSRIRMARHAAHAGLPRVAAEEFAWAEESLRHGAAGSPASENFMFARIGRAEVEASTGNLQQARQLLTALQDQARDMQLTTILLPYHQLMGEVERNSNAWPEAERAYRAAIVQSERRLSSLRGFEERTGAVQAADKSYRGLVESAWRRGDLRGALQLWEWYRSGERSGPHAESELDVTGLRRETFLVYADLPGGMSVWIFDDRGIEGYRLPVRAAEIARVARRFVRRCADFKSSEVEIRRDGRQLYDWLIAPVAHRLDPSRTLAVEPDRVIASIPIQALVDPDNRYLGERFATVSANGLADYLDRVRAAPVTPRARALVVASPALGPAITRAFPPLMQASREGAATVRRFEHVDSIQGAEATLSALERLRPQAEVLHFAGHGFSHAGNGGLLLAPADASSSSSSGTDILDGNRLTGQDWSRCRLAVLSACSSGAGEAGPVNPESLVRRLLWAGTARVVASRWNADAETSLRFMDSFYAAALSGTDIAHSLEIAANRIREGEESTTKHPYFWAGFQAFGSR